MADMIEVCCNPRGGKDASRSPMTRMTRLSPARWHSALSVVLFALCACSAERRFPLREPLRVDTDLQPVSVPCKPSPTDEDPAHVACTPEPYVSTIAWDGANNLVFRPLSDALAVRPEREAVNVNALDEVPDSAWFTNRIGAAHPSREQLLLGACTPDQRLSSEQAAPGSWVIDRGKSDGASLGFRVRTPDKAKYMFKNDAPNQPERATAASAIGAAIYHAAGFYTSCEQIVYFPREVLHLNPGLTSTDNTGVTKPFDEPALSEVLKQANRRGELYRMQASAWLPGSIIGPFRYEHTRHDDPSDVIPHDARRELRGGRVLAAWLNHFDAREQNTLDSWIASDPKRSDSSPGYVRHYYLDTSDCFGSEWAWDGVSRRLGRSYLLDWGDLAADFLTLGLTVRPWERVQRTPGFERFGYYSEREFEPDGWKNEYPNAAFSAATEHDNAWMARILSHFEPEDIAALVTLGEFSEPKDTDYLTRVLELRLQRILERYFSQLSPLAQPEITSEAQLCLTDLARRRHVWPEARFNYTASRHDVISESGVPVQLDVDGPARVCLPLAHRDVASDVPADAAERYVMLTVHNGAARHPVIVHLYDLGPSAGFRVVGLERPGP